MIVAWNDKREKFLLECGIDIDIRDGYGRTPLCLASMNGKLDLARFLIVQGANIHIGDSKLRSTTLDIIEYSADDDGNDEAKVLLHTAAKEGNLDTVKSLLERGMCVYQCPQCK